MRLALNAWFWNRPDTGSGQYLRQLVAHLPAVAPELEFSLVMPRAEAGVPGGCTVAVPRRLPAQWGKIWFEQFGFPRACRRLGADVAHVPYWAPPAAPPLPTVVTIHDLIPLLLREYRGGPGVRAYTAMVAATARSATLILTDSESSRRDILAHLGVPEERVRAIPLAADGRFRPGPCAEDEAVRQRYGLPERYVLYLGGFDVRKNVATALATYTWAGPAIGTEWPLVVAGRLPQRHSAFIPDPRRQAQALQLEPQWVRFIGAVEEADKPALYRGAVALLFPSRYEGFGLPPLEALACGTPVVGSNAASVPEVVGAAGVLLDPDDAAGMAGVLIQLAQDPAFHTQLSRSALQQAARFSWQRTAQETLAAYRQAVRV